MAKFRKKPVVIEAMQYTGDGDHPTGLCIDHPFTGPHVHTIHNNQRVDIEYGDWIIPEPDGLHFYPCKPDIFEATYEPTDEQGADAEPGLCVLCGNPMPEGEEMFKYHGYSGPCPDPAQPTMASAGG